PSANARPVQAQNAAAHCAMVRNDDRVRPITPDLKASAKRLFPGWYADEGAAILADALDILLRGDCWVDPYAVAKLNPSQNPLAISNGNDWINDPPCQPFSFPKASPGVVGVCSFGERLVASRVIVFTDGRQFGQAIAERNRNTRPTPTSAS